MSGHGLLERLLNDQLIVNGTLIVVAVSTLTFAYRHLRHLRHPRHFGGQRQSAHSKARQAQPVPAASPAAHAEDYPSWPGRPGPGALHPDHPSWPGRPDPRWAAAEAVPPPGPPPGPPPPGPGVPVPVSDWDAGSAELASWIVFEANAQATEILHEARDEAAASLAEAKKEAAELLRQASGRAAAKLAAAESEAAEVQGALAKLSTELGVAAANTPHPAAG